MSKPAVTRSELVEVAKQVREELYKLVKQMNRGNVQKHLQGQCMYGSILIYDAFKAAGIDNVKIVQGHGHYFNLCDKFLVDITATQFGQDPIIVRDYAEVKQCISSGEVLYTWWVETGVFDTPCDASLCQYRRQLNDAKKALEKVRCDNCGEVRGVKQLEGAHAG